MPVDYSKWDALELSDDSDIEVHPNVDKRSFIRAKQNQIHQQRLERKHRITTLKYEKTINDGLLSRIDALLKSLEQHRGALVGKSDGDVDEVLFDSLLEVSSDGSLGNDQPPMAPEGVHKGVEQPSYSQMLGALVDQVKVEVDKTKSDGNARFDVYLKEVKSHYAKVAGLQKDLLTELNKLEKEEGAKITSESIHTGFDSSHVSKMPSAPATGAPASKSFSGPELLNPERPSHSSDLAGAQTPGSEADIEDGSLGAGPGEDENIEASPAAKKFGRIRFGDYKASLKYIGDNPQILTEKESDGLLVEAFNAQSRACAPDVPPAQAKSESEYGRQCVEKSLLLQYCRQLGRDGVQLFFKRIQTPEHQARKLFLDDVNNTFARIRTRTAELAKERADDDEGGDREQIQLHAVDPNTQIHIVTPPPFDQCSSEGERIARQIFEQFPPGLQRALESGSLDKVNQVLGKMSVDEAELVVEQLGDAGMLSLEEGVIDATTEEGQKQVEEIERTHKMPGSAAPQLGQAKVKEVEELGFEDQVD